ncbi:hypothetical protein EON77_10095 [bacterium]|nr:MAG: hypothetical protein EON77_10095 [bacterium]
MLQSFAAAGAAAALPATGAGAPAFPAGAVIRTLFKDYRPDELAGGATLFHEHLSLGPDFMDKFNAASAEVLRRQGLPPPQGRLGPPPVAGPDPMRDVKLMAEELRSAKRDGVACIVDAGLEGAGVDVAFVREASKLAEFPIVKGAGFYTEPYYPKDLGKLGEEQIFEALLKQADDYPAGAFGEIGSWDDISSLERRVFRAVGRAHLATNLPVFTHTGIPGKSALEQLDLLEDAGVDPRRVCIGHLGNLADAALYVHKTICRRGAFVGFDRQGGGANDAPVVPLVMGLIEAGFAGNVLISGDAFRGYARPVTRFAPQLKAAGASDAILHQILVDNSRRFLAFVPKRPRRNG